jgi:hypothetical protein
MVMKAHAATGHDEVSKALLITGMCGANAGALLLAVLATGAFTGIASGWTDSARSPGPFSGERATEKNRST